MRFWADVASWPGAAQQSCCPASCGTVGVLGTLLSAEGCSMEYLGDIFFPLSSLFCTGYVKSNWQRGWCCLACWGIGSGWTPKQSLLPGTGNQAEAWLLGLPWEQTRDCEPAHSPAPKLMVPWGHTVPELLTLLSSTLWAGIWQMRLQGGRCIALRRAPSCAPTPSLRQRSRMDSAAAKLWPHVWVSLFTHAGGEAKWERQQLNGV